MEEGGAQTCICGAVALVLQTWLPPAARCYLPTVRERAPQQRDRGFAWTLGASFHNPTPFSDLGWDAGLGAGGSLGKGSVLQGA